MVFEVLQTGVGMTVWAPPHSLTARDVSASRSSTFFIAVPKSLNLCSGPLDGIKWCVKLHRGPWSALAKY